MYSIGYLTVLGMAALTGGAGLSQAGLASDVARSTRDFVAAIDRRDATAMAEAYCPGAAFMRPDGVLSDAERAAQAARVTGGGSTVARSFGRVQVRRVGEVAIVVADTRAKGQWGEAATQLTAVWLNAGSSKPCLAFLGRAPGGSAAVAATWDEAFQVSDTINRKPNAWLVGAVAGVAPGRALDIASGQGRNAIWLATRGWRVKAIDVSGEGLRLTREAAAPAKLPVETVQDDIFTHDYGRGDYDLIAFIYAPTRGLERKALDALKPGGLVVVEAFGNAADVKRAGQGVFWAPGELKELFGRAGFEIVRYEEPTDRADYGQEFAPLVRLVARKPKS